MAHQRLRGVVDRRHLRDADARNHSGRADASRPLAELHRVRASIDEREGAVARRDVPGDQFHLVLGLEPADDVEHTVGMAVSGVDDEHVDLGFDERRRALERVGPDPDRSADTQSPVLVLRRVGNPLRDVLDGDQTPETSVGVHDRELLDLVAVEDLARFVEGRADGSGDEVAVRHQSRDR